VNRVLAEADQQATNGLAARSFLAWGQATDTPEPGDIVVLRRGGPAEGHVGFFLGLTGEGADQEVMVLGGNQDWTVSERAWPKRLVLGYRRAPTN